MDFFNNLPDVLMELDALRTARGMSYQSVADASGISKSTVCRILNGQSEPTVQQLQMIAAAVQYKPPAQEIIPRDYTQEAYIDFLRAANRQQAEDTDRRVRQLQAHYNMLRQQDRRTIVVMGAILAVLVVFICALFVYDFAHLDRGWIQAAYQHYRTAALNASRSIRLIVEGIL